MYPKEISKSNSDKTLFSFVSGLNSNFGVIKLINRDCLLGFGVGSTLKVNLVELITSMILKAAQLMSYPNICS